MTITEFRGAYRWLSNFWLTPVTYQGHTYPSAEHAYQTAKATCFEDTTLMQRARTPGDAKRLGRRIKIRADWEEVKVHTMFLILRSKFNDPELGRKLLDTGYEELVEGNHWNDTFWGVCNGEGKNMLGKLLMLVRKELQLAAANNVPAEELR